MRQLNHDQLDGLSNLCFDLAKASIALAILPATNIVNNLFLVIFKMFIGLGWGIVFTYLALVLLELKGRLPK